MGIFSSKPVDIDFPSIKTYSVNFSLERLVPGVDNVHYDVHLSPRLRIITTEVIKILVARHTNSDILKSQDKREQDWIKIRDEFKTTCQEIMVEGIHKAKLTKEIQLNFLVQTAIVKLLLKEINIQYDDFIEKYKSEIRKHEVSRSSGVDTIIKLKETLADFTKDKKIYISHIANEILQYFSEIQKGELKDIREANFGSAAILPDDFFTNPIIGVNNATDDFFMLDQYVQLGNRLDDPLQYSIVLSLVKDVYRRLKLESLYPENNNEKSDATEYDMDIAENTSSETGNLEKFIRQVDNVDTLFNYIQTENKYKFNKNQQKDKQYLQQLKETAAQQKKSLTMLYNHLKENGILDRVVASFEMQPYYHQYCPPMMPLEILQYIISPREKTNTAIKLKRAKDNAGKQLPLKPLSKVSKGYKSVKNAVKKEYLIKFLKGFSRYHKDLQNYLKLKEGMDWINLTTDEKTINLSRVNHTLYDFVLPSEQVKEEKPIVNHVIIKTDVRGSTDITHQIKERGLNPASYFSLNFFDPITAILAEYGASKVFIEGDAIILSIDEREDTPEGWYSVARACGLAINMLLITQRYNKKSKKQRFPILEQGIGICHRSTPPTFLFDGDNRIMISPAINQADRLSGCSKSLRKKLDSKSLSFNLYVYQTVSEEEMGDTADDLFTRYNVNGIELNEEGFHKLQEEISLKKITCNIPEIQNNKFTVYTGTFPTISGKYQRLVIREAQVPIINQDNLKVIQLTARKYYEVCTNRKLYEYAKNKAKEWGTD